MSTSCNRTADPTEPDVSEVTARAPEPPTARRSFYAITSEQMAGCSLADGRCGRLGAPCPSGRCAARRVGRLRERRWRDKLGLFFVEGEDAVSAATAEPVELLVAGEDVEPRLLAEVSTAAHPPRVIAVYRRADLPAPSERPVTLALWHVADPGNVGTLIRTADAFGAAVQLSEGCADPTGPKALRASAGSIWRVPVVAFAPGGTACCTVGARRLAARRGRPERSHDVPARSRARGAPGRRSSATSRPGSRSTARSR